MALFEHLDFAMLETNTTPTFSLLGPHIPFCARAILNHNEKIQTNTRASTAQSMYRVEGAFYKPSQVIWAKTVNPTSLEGQRNVTEVKKLTLDYTPTIKSWSQD